MRHHTKDKGDIGVLKAMADLGQKGWIIMNPLTEHAPFDLVAYKDSKFIRVQVKYRELKDGSVRVRLASTWNDIHGRHVVPMNKEEVDIVCVYCPGTNECYYLPTKELEENLTIRIADSKNNQKKRVRFSKDLQEVPNL